MLFLGRSCSKDHNKPKWRVVKMNESDNQINIIDTNYSFVFYIIFITVILFYDFNGISDLYDAIMFFLTGN